MDREHKDAKSLAISIGIALSAGMFSIIPVAYGAPSGGKVEAGNVAIVDAGKEVNITSTTKNNVISWQDFSIAKDETVKFDGGNKTNNYLNIIRGANTSQIDGKIEGGNDVYIVNPNGVIFGKGASVNVGNLYVSTRYVSDDVAKNACDVNDMTSVLASTDKKLASDVVNLGTISANKVIAEGKNIRFLADNINASKVELRALGAKERDSAKKDLDNGYIHVGSSDGTTKNGTRYVAKATNDAMEATDDNKITWYTTVDKDNFVSKVNNNLSGNYMLTEDIVLDKNINNNFVAIHNFAGSFDGMFHTVSGLNIDIANQDAGLFASVNDARIENIGVTDSIINAQTDTNRAGAIVGYAKNSVINNVYNDKTKVTANDETIAGGIAGQLSDTKIYNSYNTGETNGGGIYGYNDRLGNSYVKNCYNVGTTGNDNKYGIFASTDTPNSTLVENSYTSSLQFNSNEGKTIVNSFRLDKNSSTITLYNSASKTNYSDTKQAEHYVDAGWSITDTGGVKIDDAGNVTKSTWRIYGGTSNPLLTAFFKGTTTASYDYTMGGVSGNNKGKDFSKVYNGSALNISNVTFGANADKNQINYSNSKDKNVTTGTYANFTSGQQGYDVAGSNITISKRQVNANVDTDFKPVKEYDGTADVTVAAVAGALTKTDIKDSGLVAGDTVTLGGTVTGKYYSDEAHTKEDKTVGKGKYGVIKFSGLKLEGADSGNYDLHINGTENTDISFKAGEITPKALTLTADASKRLTKVYDGTNAIKGTAADAIANLQVTGTVASDTVNVKGTADAEVKYDAVNAGTRNLIINGLTLDGDAAKNYYLKDSNGKVLYDPTGYFGKQIVTADNVTANNAGLITPRMLDKNSFKVYNAVTGIWENGSKTYDGTADFSYDANTRLGQDTIADGFGTDSGILASDIDKIKFALGGAKFTTDDGTTAASDATASGLATAAKKLAYTVTITGTDNKVLSNYTFDTTSTENSTTLAQQPNTTVSGAGTINKRDIKLAGNNRTNLDKEYDSQDTVAANYNTWDPATGVITYADGSAVLVASDGTSVKLTGKYNDKNVAYDVDGNVINKNITFAAELTGAKAANYNLITPSITQNKDNTAISGKITPKNLTVTFGDVTKVYDGTTKVTAAMLTGKESLNGKISGDDLTIDLANTAAKANYNSADVIMADKVTYTGIALDGTDAKNYHLQNTAYTGNGTITKKTINRAADLEWRVNDKLTKIYDGNTNLPSNVTKDNLQLFVNGVSYANNSTGLNYTLGTSSHYDSANSNNGQVQAVTYQIQLTDDSGNYNFGAGDFINTVAGAGVITPRKVFVSVNNRPTKEYDATTEVKNAKNNIAIQNTDRDTGFINRDANNLSVNGQYADKNAGLNKQVNYNLSLSGDSAGNYLLLQNNGTAGNSLQGIGDITKHKLALTIINNVRKTYDGDADVTADQVAGAITAQDNVTAIDADFANDFNTDNVIGTYGKQDSTGFTADANAGTDKAVEYKNLNTLLTGTSANNYELTLQGTALGDIAYGKGTIDKLAINAVNGWNFNFDFSGLHKVYDNSTDALVNGFDGKDKVLALNFSNGNKTIDFLHNYDVNSVSYDSVNAGTRNVTYKIKLNGDLSNNYDLTSLDTLGGVNYDSTTQTISKTIAGAGTIEQRKVYVGVQNNNSVSKIYDGTKELKPEAIANSSLIVQSKANDSGLLGTDSVTVSNTTAVKAHYADVNAGENKEVRYETGLLNDINNNYLLVDMNDKALATENGTSYVTGRGEIKKRNLYVNFDSPVKDYDGETKAKVNAVTNLVSSADTGLVNGDIFDSTKLNGDYGQVENGIFTASPDVTSDKVKYTGLLAALGDKAGNYEVQAKVGQDSANIADYVNVDVDGSFIGTGKINKYKITNANLKWDVADANKIYNGDTKVTHLDENGTTVNEAKSNIKNLAVTLKNGQEEKLQYNLADADYDDANAGSNKNVTYRLNLTNLKNFDIDNSLNGWDGTKLNLNGKGDIKKRHLSVDFADISKTYDGTKAVTSPISAVLNAGTKVGADVIARDGLNIDNVRVSGEYADKNAADDKDINYSGITGALTAGNAGVLNNYEISDRATGKGAITKRKLYVSANDVPALSKIYDGTTTIKNSDLVNRIEIAAKTNDSGLAGNDDATINGSTGNLANAMSGRYSDKKAGQAKDVYYEVALTGSDAGNYQLLNADGSELAKENGTSYVLGKGDIKKRGLNIKFTDPVKDYDGSTYAKVNAVLEQATATTGLVAGDTFVSAAINGSYGYIDTDGKFVASPDVISNKVKYTGLAAALGADADNYVLNAGDATQAITPVTADTFVGGGTINKLKITDSNLKVLLAKASKIYNGDSEVTHKTEDGSSLIAAKDNVKTLSVTLKQADGSKDKEEKLDFSVIAANYADANAGKDKSVTYKLALNNLDNFTIDSNSFSGWDGTSLNLNGTGDIAKRQLKVNFADVSKTYDGTNAVTDNINAVLNAGTKLGAEVINRDGLKLDNSKITGVYRDKNAGTAKDVSYKGILAALKAGDSSVLENYELADIGNGQGNISKATLKVKQPSEPVKKVYDGTTELVNNPYATVDKLIDTTVIDRNGDKVNDILKFNPQDAAYSDKNAGTHDVDYKVNVDNTNYELVVEPIAGSNSQVELISGADGSTDIKLKGMGVIDKRKLTFAIADASKEYDGTTAVKDAINNIKATNVIGDDNINLVVKKAWYDDKNAGISEDTDELKYHDVSYAISINNENYQLTKDTLAGHGTITRAAVIVKANPQEFRLGEKLPDTYNGQFYGGVVDADKNQMEQDFSFKLAEDEKDSTDVRYDIYPVWGWYNNRTSGNYGQNYTFTQDSTNKTAVKVTRALLPDANIVVDPDHNKTAGDVTNEVIKDVAKDIKFTPDNTSYQQASGDGANNLKLTGSTAIEYRDIYGNLIANIGTGENEDDRQASMQLKGSKTVVNLAGADVASKAAIALSSEGTGVNLTAEA
mgnify:CR=1 FL=1